MANSRIDIPRNAEELLDLGVDIYKKHESDGDASPLKALKDYDWSVEGPKLNLALLKHKEAEALRRQMELAYKERDALLGNVEGIVKGSRDVLKGVYSKTPKKLGEWGFNVRDAANPSFATAAKNK